MQIPLMHPSSEHKIGVKTRTRIRELIIAECPGQLPLTDSIMDELIDCGRILTVKRGEQLIAEGDYNPNFYILIDGIMRKWHWNDTVEITSAFALPGTQILDYHSYHGGKSSVINIEACCRSKVMEVKKEDYDRMTGRYIEFSNWRLLMAYNQLFYLELKQRVITGDARERYMAFIKARRDIMDKVPLKIIATYLGITPQYLSHLRKTLQ